ncbi:uncharacterized protein [Clytia hemisphaerica]|uniref:uncharacterized protein n=1 Tax=Clytia hemisphaerica TaxID=252671 RepID=UPI0034D72678
MELRYLQCWSETPSDSTASIPCQRPFFVPFQGSITRRCLSNGTWERHSNATQCIRLHPGQLWWRLEDLLNKYGVYRVMPAYVNTTTEPEPPKPVPFNKTSFQKTVTIHGHNTTQKLLGVEVVCPATVDPYYQYWPDGLVNSTLVQPCNRNFFENGLTERSCGSNGKWVSRVDTSNCVKRSNGTAIALHFQTFVGRFGYETDLYTTESFLAKTGLFNASSSVRPSSNATTTKSITFTTSIDTTKTPNKTSAFSNTTTSPSATRLSRITPSEEEHIKNIFTIKCKEISNRTDSSPTNMTCSGHVDEYYHCWQETPANSTIRIPCISLYFYSDRHIDRHCNHHGEWEDINIDDICLPLEEYEVLKRWKTLESLAPLTSTLDSFSKFALTSLIPASGSSTPLIPLSESPGTSSPPLDSSAPTSDSQEP